VAPDSWPGSTARHFTLVESRFDAPVSQLDVAGSADVIAAGAFSMVAGLPAAHIARWNGATWRPLGPGVPGAVTALAHNGGVVYVSSVNDGSGALLLGAFDGITWRELATPGCRPDPAAGCSTSTRSSRSSAA